MMITHIYLKKGAVVPRHQHDNEQITYVLEGALRFRLGNEQQVDVRAGNVLVIPSNLPHSAEALEDTLDVDIFDPPRRDFLRKYFNVPVDNVRFFPAWREYLYLNVLGFPPERVYIENWPAEVPQPTL